MRDDGKRDGLNLLISGGNSDKVGGGSEVEGQTVSVQRQICIQQREKGLKISTQCQSMDLCINPLSTDSSLSSPQESKLLPETRSPTKIFSIYPDSI